MIFSFLLTWQTKAFCPPQSLHLGHWNPGHLIKQFWNIANLLWSNIVFEQVEWKYFTGRVLRPQTLWPLDDLKLGLPENINATIFMTNLSRIASSLGQDINDAINSNQDRNPGYHDNYYDQIWHWWHWCRHQFWPGWGPRHGALGQAFDEEADCQHCLGLPSLRLSHWVLCDTETHEVFVNSKIIAPKKGVFCFMCKHLKTQMLKTQFSTGTHQHSDSLTLQLPTSGYFLKRERFCE